MLEVEHILSHHGEPPPFWPATATTATATTATATATATIIITIDTAIAIVTGKAVDGGDADRLGRHWRGRDVESRPRMSSRTHKREEQIWKAG